ncbi:MAG: helix-turn-helix domain-containing protein [Rubrivivax sp.]|nr:MAG: helix-turn-helix domain-containing protein [Rubrivivax sp.]
MPTAPSTPAAADAIPFLLLPNWLSAAAHCGIDLGAILGEVGLDLGTIEPETSLIPYESMIRALAICTVETHRRQRGLHFPFVLGSNFVFQYMPDIETYLATSATLRDALPVFDWLRLLINPHLQQRLVEEAGQACIAVDWQALPPHMDDLVHDCVDITFSGTLKFARLLAGNDFQLRSVHLRRQRPMVDPQIYEAHFQAPVLFGQPQDAAYFDPHWIDRPLQSALPTLHQRAAERVERRLVELMPPGDTVASLLEQSLVSNPQLLSERMETVAERLSLHPRTLQRRLREAGMNYSDLQARVRFRLATQWLKEGSRSVEAISEALGFADRRSFTQAFVRWAKVSPSQFRRLEGFP